MARPTMACSDSHVCPTVQTNRPLASWSPEMVPRNMQLNETLRSNARELHGIPLIPLNCTFGVVNEKAPVSFKTALIKEAKLRGGKRSKVSVVFVVRRPGCASCREHGLQLTELAKEERGVSFWGIVKETGIEEEGIITFYKEFFHFPLYKDEKWRTYKAMGDRKLSPLKAIKRAFEARSRWTRKGITNQFKAGDIWLQGGILIFKNGVLRYAYEEDFGRELNLSEIQATIQVLREEDEGDLTSSESETSDGSFKFKSTRTEI
jgi:hypothetical protein